MPSTPLVLLLLFTLSWTVNALGQGSEADYERAATLNDRTRRKVFREQVALQWLPGDSGCWYRIETAADIFEYILVDPVAGARSPLFDQAKLAEQLTAALGRSINHHDLPLRGVQLTDDLQYVRFHTLPGGRKDWEWNRESHELQPHSAAAGETQRQFQLRPSPQGGESTSVQFVNRTAGRLNIYWLNFEGAKQAYGTVEAGKTFQHQTYVGHLWLITDANDRPLTIEESVADPVPVEISETGTQLVEPVTPGVRRPRDVSPDGAYRVLLRDHNVWLVHRESKVETQLTTQGTAADSFSGRVHWSPDSHSFVVQQTSAGDERQVHIVESSPKDQVQPKLHTFTYDKPGDRLPVSRPRLFRVNNASQVQIEEVLFENAWAINDVHWWPDSSAFVFEYNQRGHQCLRVVEVDAQTGTARAIVDETSPTFIDYAGKHFLQYLDDTREILWMSERDGWNHLYLVDASTGEVKQQITQGDWVVRRVEKVDTSRRQIWLQAGGVVPDEDPYQIHLCRVNFDGTDFKRLTDGDGTHTWTYSPTGQYLLDTWSRVDQPPVTVLRDAETGQLLCELEVADCSQLLETGWQMPERFVATGRDGQTGIHGIILRPTNFDPARKYPVIESIYAGPHGAFVPKTFDRHIGRLRFAELGFIVVQIDGMGTSQRSKAFHDVCWQNLGDSGFPDRIAWLQAAAAQHPELDLSRVGIYGGSAGGQSTVRALLAYPDFYKVGCADCGCHDNRMDKVWWNELWMGWPVGPHYEAQSNVTNAHRLQGQLLLMVGEMDHNVDPASTMQVVNALIKADKDFELIVFPGADHGAGSSPYGIRRQMDFFVRHLHHREPRWR